MSLDVVKIFLFKKLTELRLEIENLNLNLNHIRIAVL